MRGKIDLLHGRVNTATSPFTSNTRPILRLGTMKRPTDSSDARMTTEHMGSHYGRLAIMTALSFVAMYVLMYAMVDRLENVHMNLNQVYMAGLMAVSMVIIEVAIMSRMYRDKRLNAAIILASFVALAGFWVMIRRQTAISDRQFLRSMIPHHAGALLMCANAPIRDAEIKRLCESILASQQSEIDQMTAKLTELAN
jgi:hypothetical protein